MVRKLLILTACLLLFGGCSSNHELRTDVPQLISRQTMNQLLIFTEQDDEVLECYTLIEKGSSGYAIPELSNQDVYQLNLNNADQVKKLLKEPMMIVSVLSLPGYGQKLGLTECQDMFIMIEIDEGLRLKAGRKALRDCDENQYLEMIKAEYIRLGVMEERK